MENILQHHGVKGQKWGRRRFQNKDGTLTPAGKKRYDNEYMQLREEKKVLTNKKKTAAKIQKLDDMRKANDELRKEVEGSPAPKKKGKTGPVEEKPKGIQDLSTEELRARTDRTRAEKDYISAQMELSRLQPEKVSAGRKFAEKVFKEQIVPAAVDVGKKQAEKYLKKKLGLDDSTADALKKESDRLKREADDWTNKKRADQAKEYFRQKEKRDSNTDDSESKDNEAREKAQKQVDDYNKNWWKNDSVKPMGSPGDNNKNNNKDFVNKPLLGDSSKSNRENFSNKSIFDEDVETFVATGKDVVGKGTSKFTGWDKPPAKDVVWDGQKYVDELLGLPDPDRRKKR